MWIKNNQLFTLDFVYGFLADVCTAYFFLVGDYYFGLAFI